MTRVRRAITALLFFLFLSFLFSINVAISSFIECMPVESPFPPPFPQILGVCVGGGGGGGCEWVSVCVCCTHLFSFFPLAFVLVNDLSLVSHCFLFWKCVRFCFRFCCRLFLFVVCTCILCLLPCYTRCSFIVVLSCTPTGVSEINHLTWWQGMGDSCTSSLSPTFKRVKPQSSFPCRILFYHRQFRLFHRNLPWKRFCFQKRFLQSHCPEIRGRACVRACMWLPKRLEPERVRCSKCHFFSFFFFCFCFFFFFFFFFFSLLLLLLLFLLVPCLRKGVTGILIYLLQWITYSKTFFNWLFNKRSYQS